MYVLLRQIYSPPGFMTSKFDEKGITTNSRGPDDMFETYSLNTCIYYVVGITSLYVQCTANE